jgi:hypothetical protein
MLTAVFQTHHSFVVVSCRNGDIASMWAHARALCVGNDVENRLDAIAEMVAMARSPPHSWPGLSHAIAQLQLRLAHEAPRSAGLDIGSRILPQFVLRALQHSNFNYMRVDITLLNKVSIDITVDRINQDMTTAHAGSLSRPGARAFHAQAEQDSAQIDQESLPPAQAMAATGTVGTCFNWRDGKTCTFGDRCRFSHDGVKGVSTDAKSSSQLTGSCITCGSASHGINECPVRAKQLRDAATKKKRDAGNKKAAAASAHLAKVTAELATVKAMVAKPPAPPASAWPPPPSAPIDQVSALQAQLANALANQSGRGP